MPIVYGHPSSCGDCTGSEPTCRCCPYGVDEQGRAISAHTEILRLRAELAVLREPAGEAAVAGKSIDPLDAYRGAERALRDEIERAITSYIIRDRAGLFVKGTLYLANDIMRMTEAREPAGEALIEVAAGIIQREFSLAYPACAVRVARTIFDAVLPRVRAEGWLRQQVIDAAYAAMSEAYENHPDGWLLQQIDGQRLSDALDALDAATVPPAPEAAP